MASAEHDPPRPGLRERKRHETLQRIADAGVRLFLDKGYEKTTIEEIAAAADISRRTFFYYFKSKDDILFSMQAGMGQRIADALREEPLEKAPIDALRDAIVRTSAAYSREDMLAIDRLMRSNETIQLRKQASYVQHEKIVFDALRERWPDPVRETGLKLVAMMAIGAIRLSLERFNQEDGKRPLTALLTEAFAALKIEI
jgi:AcrR family transcriptional regulator